ncbi:pilus assembly protein TadG-related protein (plasmid) [Neorhizobium galegae]|nr:pilus assembly protein TadG-related protein [Neorhizobium galegae]
MIRKLSAKLHRDEKGFLSPIILFMVIALAYMIVWVLNTGQSLYDKQRTQDTADAAAMVHSDWSARYLNIMAMNNVASSQATVLLVASTAYQVALAELQFRSLWVAGKLAEYTLQDGLGPPNFRIPVPVPYCPTWGKTPLIGGLLQAACSAYQVIRAAGAVRATAYFWSSMFKYEPQNLMSKAEDIISAMNDMNKYLVDSFPERVGNEGLNLVRLNRVDHLVYHPACNAGDTCDAGKEGQGGDLPVETSVGYTQLAYQEMCMAMSAGTQDFGLTIRGEFANRGFPDGKGPLTAGGKDNTHIRDHVNHEGGMATELPAFYWFYEVFGPAYYTGLPFRQLVESQTGGVDLDPIFDEPAFWATSSGASPMLWAMPSTRLSILRSTRLPTRWASISASPTLSSSASTYRRAIPRSRKRTTTTSPRSSIRFGRRLAWAARAAAPASAAS